MDPERSDVVSRLYARAFRKTPAARANEEISQQRDLHVERFGSVIAYEVVAESDDAGEPRHERWLRLFSLHLRAKRVTPYACDHVFVAVFCGEELAFLRGVDFLEVLLDEAGFREGDLRTRFVAWRVAEAEALAPVAVGEARDTPPKILALPEPPKNDPA